MKDMVGKFLDRGRAIGQLVDGAGHVGREPARVHAGIGKYQLHVRAIGKHQLLDEVDEFDIRIAAQLGRVGRSLEGAQTDRIELADQFLAFEALRRPALFHRTAPAIDCQSITCHISSDLTKTLRWIERRCAWFDQFLRAYEQPAHLSESANRPRNCAPLCDSISHTGFGNFTTTDFGNRRHCRRNAYPA